MAVADLIRSEALRQGVPPDIALRVAQVESGLNPNARGARGEIGIMQLMPGTAMELGVDPYDIMENIRGGIRYLRMMYERFGDWSLAVAAYNAGPGNVERGNIPSGYVRKVLGTPTFTTEVVSTPEEAPWWALAIAFAALIYLLTD
jgi:soluble lytic murein transglycosylase-like protein